MVEDSALSINYKIALRQPDESVEVSVSVPNGGWDENYPTIEALCQQSVEAALNVNVLGTHSIEVSVVLADDKMLRALNRDKRGIDRATNVLAFPGDSIEEAMASGVPCLLGDIVLAYETIAREALEVGMAFEDRLVHLIVHGTLHLLGYDHRTLREAEAMESIEISVLAQLGIPDPYFKNLGL